MSLKLTLSLKWINKGPEDFVLLLGRIQIGHVYWLNDRSKWVSRGHTLTDHRSEHHATHEEAQTALENALKDLETVGDELPPPYPFCHSPKQCAGKGYCTRDPACNN